jgi:sigma-B regulation protein RsbU (phosphoserine phosphatase)
MAISIRWEGTMFRRLRIGPRLALLTLFGCSLVLGALTGFCYLFGSRQIGQETREKAICVAVGTANRIEAVQRGVEKVAQGCAARVTDGERSPGRVAGILARTVAANPEIYGAAFAYAPRGAADRLKRTAPCAYRSGGRVVLKDLGADNYRYDVWDWYTLPRDLERPVWSEPYFDESGGGALMVTYSVPVFDGQGAAKELVGVVTCDVSLDWLTELLNSIRFARTGYAFLISKNGTYICHPKPEFVIRESVFSVAEAFRRPELRPLGQRMVSGETGYIPLRNLLDNEPSHLAFAPVPSTGWSVSVIVTDAELLAPVVSLSRSVAAVGAAGFGLLLLIIVSIARTISRPIRALDDAAETLAGGDLDAPLPSVPGNDEVAHLAESFSRMRIELKRSMEDLRVTTAARQKIESELEIARTIQMSLVPRTFPAFPNRPEFDLYAELHPARAIGGDFYDFFMLDDYRVCLAIGDVSDKGVPAALFMAVVRTFLKAIWRAEESPAATLCRLNNELAEDNATSMFVTLLCAVVDLRDGSMRYACGGHNLPYLMGPDGVVRQLSRMEGIAIGAMEGARFEEGVERMAPGEVFFFYTDGVSEAMNRAEELFGEARMVDALRGCACISSMAGLVGELRNSVEGFADGAEQSDDLTIMAFRYLGPTTGETRDES